MQRLHVNLPAEIHTILRTMCDQEVRNVSSQIQFLIKEAHKKSFVDALKSEERSTLDDGVIGSHRV